MSIDKHFPLPLEGVFVGKGQWMLTKPFKYVNPPVDITVPEQFITDGASIPRPFWSFIGSPWGGRYAKATVPHDWGYHVQTKTRKEVDDDFLDGMRILGVPKWKRIIMYFSVRLGAGFIWKIRKESK